MTYITFYMTERNIKYTKINNLKNTFDRSEKMFCAETNTRNQQIDKHTSMGYASKIGY